MGGRVIHGSRPIKHTEYEDGSVEKGPQALFPMRATVRDKNKYSELYTE